MNYSNDDPQSFSSYSQNYNVSMKQAAELSKNPDSCIKIVQDVRKISLPWAFISRLKEGTDIVLDKEICRYNKKLAGVPISRGKSHIVDEHSIVVEDHPQFHFSVKCRFAVFRPRVGATLPAVVVRVDEGQIVCSVYGVVNANIWRNQEKTKTRKRMPNVGDQVNIVIGRARLFRRSLQLDAKLSN